MASPDHRISSTASGLTRYTCAMPRSGTASRWGSDDNPTFPACDTVRQAARVCLLEANPAAKRDATRAAAAAFFAGALPLGGDLHVPSDAPCEAARPLKPVLVSARGLPQRGLGTDEGRAAFIHAIAHIEFNAINLAWDAVWRFDGMPPQFYADWVRVADDEARHFTLLSERLAELGHAYGDFDAHDGLWDMARKTAHSCLERMALVPRVLEARGLDVTPAMIVRLRGVGDHRSIEILERILREEVAHVAAGSRWFAWCCERAGVAPSATFDALITRYARGSVRKPFNLEARTAAGFDEADMQALDRLASAPA